MKSTDKPKALGPFDFLNAINDGVRGKNLLGDCYADNSQGAMPDSADKQYVPFIINRGLSYFTDSVFYANEMNLHAHLPAKMQFDFLRNGLRPRKRFSKWSKKIDDSADVALIMDKYQYSAEKARAVLHLFDEDALNEMRVKGDQGGTGKKKKK